jgi:hypothetical protein
MDLPEKVLYNQIHPVKLFTDWFTTFISFVLVWFQKLSAGLIVAFVPTLIVRLILIRFADLERYKASLFGRYVARYMTRAAQAVRLTGYALAAIGAWTHFLPLVPIGIAVILVGWGWGLLFRQYKGNGSAGGLTVDLCDASFAYLVRISTSLVDDRTMSK